MWSLWKRLQVANPDLTQAVSLVVERWVDSSFKLLPERLRIWKLLYLTSEEKYVWKSFKGCLRHLGHSTGVTTESAADADLSLLIPGLAVQPWKPFNENAPPPRPSWTVETIPPNACLYRINCEIEYDLFCRVSKLLQTQWHGNCQRRAERLRPFLTLDAHSDKFNISLQFRKKNILL